jgi:hypothetical protein
MTGADPASRDRRRFGVLCVLAHVALAWMVRFDLRRGDQIASLAYPLDTSSMYAPNLDLTEKPCPQMTQMDADACH